VTRHILWQTALVLFGIASILVILFQLASVEPPPPVETSEVPATGGTYVEGILGYSTTINPILAPSMLQGNPVDQDLSALVFDGLTSLQSSGEISPSLAIGWEVSDEGTVYEFRLREDVKWHDGAPFTASDVAFTIQAIQDPGFQGDPALRALWSTVVVDQPNDHTIKFTLEEPFPSFPLYTTIGLLPAHLLSEVAATELPGHDFSTKNPVGTGQFMVKSISSDRVVLEANPDYRGSRAYLEGVEFWFYADWEGLIADYEQGVLHGFHPAGLASLPVITELPTLQVYSAPSAGYGLVYLNQNRESVPFFQEVEVRQALLYALDRQLLIDRALGGWGLVADSPILPNMWAHDPSLRQYGFDPERAIGLLDASGWMDSNADRIRDKDGIDFAFTLLTSDEPTMLELAEELADQWRAVGVDVSIRAVSSEAAAHFIRSRNFDAALAEIGLSADPDPYPLWHSTQAESGQNYSGFANEDADVVMETARFATQREQRAELYRTFQHIFTEQVPALLLYYPIYTYAVDGQVRGVQLSPLLHSSNRFRSIGDWHTETEETVVSKNVNLDKPQN
jgi:peptide/nickel transport system substrate-binding protein